MQDNTMPYGSVVIEMGSGEYFLAPGNRLVASFTIANLSGQEDYYDIMVRGVPESWVGLDIPAVHLDPGERRKIDFTIQSPDYSLLSQGLYPVTIRAVSQSTPEWWGETTFNLRMGAIAAYDRQDTDASTGQVEVRIDDFQMSVNPGENLSIPLTIINPGPADENFILTIEGFPPGWVSSPTSMVHLAPGQQVNQAVNIHPPLSPTSRAGRHPFRVRAASQADARQGTTVDGVLTVGAISQFASDLTPRRVDAGQTGRLRIHNLGNIQETFTIRLQSPGDDLEYVPVRSGPLRVYPGQSASFDFAVSPRSPNWMGGAETFPYSLIVQSSDGETQVHQGEVVSRSLIPIWVLPALLAFCFTAVCGVGFLWNWNQNRLAESTETAAEQLAFLDSQTATAEIAAQTMSAVALPVESATVLPSTPTPFPSFTNAPSLTPAPSETAVSSTFTPIPPSRTPMPVPPTPIPSTPVLPTLVPPTLVRPTNIAPPVKIPTRPLPTNTPPPPEDTAPPTTEILHPPTITPTLPEPTITMTMTAAPVIAGTVTQTVVETRVPLPVTGEQRIVFSADPGGLSQLYLYDSSQDVSEPRRLTESNGSDNQPAWSPDGNQIVFTSNRDGNSEIYVMNADGTGPVNLTNSSSNESDPVWSPDGKQVAFTTDQDNNNEIYVMNADGSSPVNLTQNPANDSLPGWYQQKGLSTSESQILFTTDRDGNNEIYAMQPDGSDPTNLTQNPAADSQSSVPYSGELAAFLSDRDGDPDIFVMNVDGSKAVNLTKDTASEGRPAWSPDGQWLAFASDPDGNQDIFVMNAQGEQRTRIIQSPADEADPTWH